MKEKQLHKERQREIRQAKYQKQGTSLSIDDKIKSKAKREEQEHNEMVAKANARKKQIEQQLKRKLVQNKERLEDLIEQRQVQRKIKTARIRSLQRDHEAALDSIRDKWEVQGSAGERQVNTLRIMRDEQILKHLSNNDRAINHQINMQRRNRVKKDYRNVLFGRIHSQQNKRDA